MNLRKRRGKAGMYIHFATDLREQILLDSLCVAFALSKNEPYLRIAVFFVEGVDCFSCSSELTEGESRFVLRGAAAGAGREGGTAAGFGLGGGPSSSDDSEYSSTLDLAGTAF